MELASHGGKDLFITSFGLWSGVLGGMLSRTLLALTWSLSPFAPLIEWVNVGNSGSTSPGLNKS
jgi:hypothetical protein